MRVLILTGSPHSQGTTALLADEFSMGAKSAGHDVIRIDTAKLQIHPCRGCSYCRKTGGICVFNDGMTHIYPELLWADAVVLVTPLYYFGMTAQLKNTLDRFFAVNSELRNGNKQFLLISACHDKESWAMEALVLHFRTVARYLNWQDKGMVLAQGADSRKDLEGTEYPRLARELGESLGAR